MQKIGNTTTTANAAAEFTEGNAQAGVGATLLTAAWLNTIQRELASAVTGAGLALDPKDDTQLYRAMYGVAKGQAAAAVAANPVARVIATPTVSGSTSVAPATNFTLTASSTSRLTGGVVASFNWTKPDGSIVNTAASNSQASLTMQVAGAAGETRTVTVEAVDGDGNKSAPKSVTLTLINNTAPSLAGFSHTVPSSITQGTSKAVSFTGATDADNDAITYLVEPGTSGFTFSKTSGITAGENITMTVPGSTLPSDGRSFTVYAVDARGAKTGTNISVTVVGQSSWEFATAGTQTFKPPVSGSYRVTAYGAGAPGRYEYAAGSGGGCAVSVVTLDATASYAVTVGKGGTVGSTPTDGGTSSFGTLLSATGGKVGTSSNTDATPGQGIGGNVSNNVGGKGAASRSGYGSSGASCAGPGVDGKAGTMGAYAARVPGAASPGGRAGRGGDSGSGSTQETMRPAESGYQAGGGGGTRTTISTYDADGAAGLVIVEYIGS